MTLSQEIAHHFRQVYFGGNWTSVNMKDTLADLDWQIAFTTIHNCNSIARLVFHTNYYVDVIIKVLEGGPLDAHDKFSFEMPPCDNEEAWNTLVEKSLKDAVKFAELVELLPDTKLFEFFANEKYGTYYRNLHGVIEHTHYHLGQIVLLKKMIKEE